MQVQTVFRAGNSNVITIPSSLGDRYDIKNGRKVILEDVPEVNGILIKRAVKGTFPKKEEGVTKEFKLWLKQALEEDAEILDELANR